MTDPAGDDAVRALVVQYAPAMLPGADIDTNGVDLLVPVAEGRVRVNLSGLLEQARAQPGHVQVETVRRWLAEIAGQLRSLPPTPQPSTIAVESLRLRIMPAWEPTALAAVTSSAVPRSFDAVVLYPDADRWSYLSSDQAGQFGGQVEAAAAAAQHTIVNELLDVDVRDHDLDDQGQLRMIAKDGNPFVTTALLSLARFVAIPEVVDALVIAPRYSAIALRPITTRGDIRVASRLAAISADLHAQASDPCTTTVQWWHDGVFFPLDFDADGTAILPDELGPVLAGLP